MSIVEVVPVTTPAEMKRFIRLAPEINAGDPNFVPQLEMERGEAFSPKVNPYFAHAETQFFLARRDGRDVGRISAQIDRLVKNPDEGHFGSLVAIDDRAVFDALIQAAESWLLARGKTRILGPFNLSINEETGLLIKGFDTPPMMLMPHDPAYAAAHVEANGYVKTKDLIAYLYNIENDLPVAARRLLARRRPKGMTVRTLDVKRYREEFDTVTAIFNDAWTENWGFIPFTEAEINHMAKSLKPLIDPKCVVIVEMDGKPIGFGIVLPNLNELIRDFKGKLLPFNWARLLWRLKKGTRTARVPLMGIRRDFEKGLVTGLAPFLIIDEMRNALLAKGTTRQIELSWILEDNLPMRHVIEALGADPYKTYRVYEKTLSRS